MKSYAKDISNGTDLTARVIGAASSSSSSKSSKSIDPIALPYDYFNDDERPSTSKRSSGQSNTAAVQNESLWCEAKSDEGHTYYWNIKTNGNFLNFPNIIFYLLMRFINRIYMGKA